MFGQSDTDRSQDQGGCREAPGMKEGGGKDTAVGTRTGGEAAMRAMSVLENAKSNGHRKTHRAEPDGTGRKFAHPPRADPSRESGGAVGRSRSREESRANPVGAKGRRMRRAKQAKTSRGVSRYERAPGEIRFPGLDAGRARGGYARGPVAGKMRRTPPGTVALCYATAGCGNPHGRRCGRITGRNPRYPSDQQSRLTPSPRRRGPSGGCRGNSRSR